MKKTITLFFYLICLAALANTNASSQKTLSNKSKSDKTENRTVDVQHLVLNLQFDFAKRQASGKATLTFSVLSPTNAVTLDAGLLSIYEIHLSDGKALNYDICDTVQTQNLKISLGRIYKPNEKLSIIIDYHTNYINETDPTNIGGSTGKGLRFFSPSTTEPNRYKQIWSMGEGEGNSYWFPCVDTPDDWLTTELIFTIEKPLSVISVGKLIAQKDNGNGTQTFHYTMDTPYSNHKIAFVVGEYLDLKSQAKQTTLHQYCYPAEKEATKATVERLADMVHFFEDLTGHPYPYESYSQVFVQELPWGSSSPGMAVLTENMVDDYSTHKDYLYLWDMLEGEALANQWFGNLIACRKWSDYWLDKALSRYSSCLYEEYKNGKAEYLLWQLSFDQGNYFNDWSAGNKQAVVNKAIKDVNAFINSNYPNSRGALVLHMLRKELGEVDWRKSIQAYVKLNSSKTVTTEDFIAAIKTATGKDMVWFFDQWVYKTGHPIFEVSKKYNSQTKQLLLKVKQTQKPDSASTNQVEYFKGKMAIEIDSRIETIFIESKPEHTYAISSREEPTLVNFDFEGTWIKELNFEKTLQEQLYELTNSRDVVLRNTNLGNLMAFANNDSASIEDKQKVYTAIEKVIGGKEYWRLRYNALLWYQNILITAAKNKPLILSPTSSKLLFDLIKNDSSWVKTAAITLVGVTQDPTIADVYIGLLNDASERVVNAAAIALGRTKDPKAFDALVKLKDKPSWKNQSAISTLNGLRVLGDKRGVDIAMQYINASQIPHWTLGTATWDHRLAAVQTLAALGETDKAYKLIQQNFEKALSENNLNDIFFNLLQITMLQDSQGQVCFDQLKQKYEGNEIVLNEGKKLEEQFQASIVKHK